MQHQPPLTDVPADVFAGVDVSKAKLDVFIDTPSKTFSVSNDADGVARLVQTFADTKVSQVIVEATGRYHRRLAADLLAAGIHVSVVNPQRVREFAKASGQLAKTDALDARILAAFGRALRPLSLAKPKEKQLVLNELVAQRTHLVRQRAAEINRLDDSLPKLVQGQNAKLQRLLSQQIEDLDKAIAKLIEADDDWKDKVRILNSFPGVKSTTACNLLAHFPELGTLDRGAVGKLAGVAPLNCDSGPCKGQRHISGGRVVVRNAVYMSALTAMFHNPRFKAYAQRLKAAGKAHNLIVIACMRKLLIILNQMLKTKTLWNPNLAFQNP